MGFWDKIKETAPAPRSGLPPRRSFDSRDLPTGSGLNHEAALDHYLERQAQQQPSRSIQSEYVGQDEDMQEGMIGAVDAARAWKGNSNSIMTAAKSGETDRCPRCNSVRFLHRENLKKFNSKVGMYMSVGERCFDCGYPQEQGEMLMGIPSKVIGNPRLARSAAQMGKVIPNGPMFTGETGDGI